MKKRTYKMFVEDILESMNKIERYIKGVDYEGVAKNEMVMDAIMRNLEIIGEAAKSIPDAVREKYPDIPWKRMVGLRNIAIHRYFGVDLSIIGEIVTKNLPETKPKIETMLESLNKQTE